MNIKKYLRGFGDLSWGDLLLKPSQNVQKRCKCLRFGLLFPPISKELEERTQFDVQKRIECNRIGGCGVLECVLVSVSWEDLTWSFVSSTSVWVVAWIHHRCYIFQYRYGVSFTLGAFGTILVNDVAEMRRRNKTFQGEKAVGVFCSLPLNFKGK